MQKLLFICSRNRKRSLTAEQIFSGIPGYQVRSAGTQPDARTFKKIRGPTPIIKLIGARRIFRLGSVAFLGGHAVEGNDLLAAAAFLRLRTIPFVGEKTFEGRE